MVAGRDEVHAALEVWRDGLVSLSGANRLIQFKASRTGAVLIDSPSPDEVLSGIDSGRPLAFRGDDEADESESRPLPPSILHSPRPDKDLGPILRNLKRRADTEFLDRGLLVLYVAFGMLHWKDVDDTTMVSPLLLVPVSLTSEGPKGTPRLGSSEDDAVLNPALTLRMRDFNIAFPPMEELDGLAASQVLHLIEEAIREHPDWEVRQTTYLSTFSFAKEAMFRDLQDNEDLIAEHPIVRALATSDPTQQSPEFIFDAISPEDIERVAPPEDTPLVLDADSSQRAAVAAAIAGKTFVMDGPPGTGKSQTIANMIGALLHAGKSVLFVSEKIAALDVVRNRLAEAGLGNYLLELHSHKASRKEVAAELLRTLDNEPLPPRGMDGLSRAAVIERRKQLNDYAEGMNADREPLSMSLHRVLGILSTYQHLPSAPIPERPPTDLTQTSYRAVQETATRLERAWRPASQGSSFLWREAVDESSLDIRLYQAEAALEQLDGTLTLNRDLVDAFGLTRPSDTPRLVALIAHQHQDHSPGVLEQWLTVEDSTRLEQMHTELMRQIQTIRDAESAALESSGVRWTSLPGPDTVPVSPGPVPASPSPLELERLTSEVLDATADRFEVTARSLGEQWNALRNLSASLGLAEPASFAQADQLMRLVDLGKRSVRPQRRWLTVEGLHEARDTARSLHEHVAALEAAEAKALGVFTPEALKAPLADLQDRFTNLHKGLKKLGGNYRTDKKTVASLLTSASTVKDGISHLSDAIEWGDATRAFETFSATRSDTLGAYWNGRTTNFEDLNSALAVADEALAISGGNIPGPLADFLSAPEAHQGHLAIVEASRSTFDAWISALAPPPSLNGRPELLVEPIAASIAWLDAHMKPMRQAAKRVSSVDRATERLLTLDQTDRLLELRQAVVTAHADLTRAGGAYGAAFGAHYAGADTDLTSLGEALAWADRLRSLARGPLTSGQVKALAGSNMVTNLEAVYGKWTDARDRVVNAFASARREELLRELDEFLNAHDFINELREDTVGQQEWFAYQAARSDLAELGLDTAIDFCIEQRVPTVEVPGVLERALLRAWADATIHGDRRLRPLLAEDRAALVEEYRDLDRQLIVNATTDIIRSANTRRPQRSSLGEPAVIRRQGMMKRRHMPVRDLIGATRTTSLAIKPCFMMSPLAVSQYLPPDMNFDVVIFDEASQVTPGDSINCIYRGRALILAGDDKQLPPTSFFERVVDEEGNDETDVADFTSILELAKGCGAFNNLGLRWHYRSRHEDLIAFSNYKFYEGKLVTYPSSHSSGDNVGVEFFNAHGTYRRGGGADNPQEAAKVAERVIQHFSDRPALTLGVVTFSVVQADAVIAAIDQAREDRRDLDRFFDTGDRLDGFFVRSLESVQGDERDVIIFSVGYGPDEAGKVSTGFGVLNKPKGWRRLNVGITRARQRVEVVASMRAGDIPPSQNENVEYLRAYLDYAERGMSTLAIEHSTTGLGPESPFEESVLSTIRGWGYTVEPQVGAAGFRIDIGVRHPAHPGMFAIGVECDGYQYHSAPAARDRDRLREQILSGLGWTLHRIWGTAWYRNRKQEEARLREAIETAIAEPADGRVRQTAALNRPTVETVATEIDQVPEWTTEYTLCQPQKLPYWVEPAEPANHLHLVDSLEALAQAEGPVHLDVVYERVRDWWGVGRVSYKLRGNIDLAIKRAQVIREDDFIDLPGRSVDRVRTPTRLASRKVEQVHLSELGLASERLLRDVGAAPRAELIVGVARIFGWSRTGSIVDRGINEAIDLLIADGVAVERDSSLSILG